MPSYPTRFSDTHEASFPSSEVCHTPQSLYIHCFPGPYNGIHVEYRLGVIEKTSTLNRLYTTVLYI